MATSDIRILLVGRTGHGKSSTGNSIIGQTVFEISESSKSKTKTCRWSNKYRRFGKIVEVVDTPGFFDTDSDHITVHKELLKALALTTPGFHVIAFVLMRGRFTEEIQKTQDLFFQWFGEEVRKFACVILTDTNSEEAKTKYVHDDPHEKLAELVRICNDNVVPLNNVASQEQKESQIKKLFQVIENIKQKNGNQHFSNLAFRLAEEYINSKYPKELTFESILILRDAGLNMQLSGDQCSYLDKMFSVSIEKSNASCNTEGTNENDNEKLPSERMVVVEEQSEASASGIIFGNLPIFDNSSNKRIANAPVKQTCARVEQDESTSGSFNPPIAASENLKDEFGLSFPETDEVPGRLDVQFDSNISQDFAHVNRYQSESGQNIMQASASDQSEEQIQRRQQTKSSRRDRRIDIESVHWDSHLDNFKGKVNQGANGDEDLHGLSGYFKKAWRYCKSKVKGCVLL